MVPTFLRDPRTLTLLEMLQPRAFGSQSLTSYINNFSMTQYMCIVQCTMFTVFNYFN